MKDNRILQKRNFSFTGSLLGAVLISGLVACSDGGGSNPAVTPASNPATPAPVDVASKSCTPEADLLKPPSSSSASIVSGTPVGVTDADSKKAILLMSQKKNTTTKSICAATAIAPNVLLTAAHCIADIQTVVFHTSLSCESGFDARAHAVTADSAIVHKDWVSGAPSANNTANDIALVILKQNIPSAFRIVKIADPSKVDYKSGVVKFIGYGTTDVKAGGSGIMRVTTLPMSKLETDIKRNIVKIDQSSGHGVCYGDAGGASLVMVNGDEQLLGVNSILTPPALDKTIDCRDQAVQALGFGHKAWIKSTLAQRGITINL